VAVILEFIERIKAKKRIPEIDAKDKRLVLLEVDGDAWEDHDEDEEMDLDNDQMKTDVKLQLYEKSKNNKNDLKTYLETKSKDELLQILIKAASDYPDLHDELVFKARLLTTNEKKLIKTVKAEIAQATSEPGWWDHWNQEGFRPDFSRVEAGLKKLLDHGLADEVVKIGREFFYAASRQVEQSDDDGYTAQDILEIMDIVFKALADCSLPAFEKLKEAVEYGLNDEYGLCERLEKFWKKRFHKDDWSRLADDLQAKLGQKSPANQNGEDSFSRNYRRNKLTNEIINALKNSGRDNEIIPLCIREAEKTKSYQRLVENLMAIGDYSGAEEWIRKGYADTKTDLPGIASGLRERLLEIRAKKHDWLFVAAVRSEQFFEDPSLEAYHDLQKACTKAGVWDKAQSPVLRFLETAIMPAANATTWPLPSSGLEPVKPRYARSAPFIEVAIQIAIKEKRIPDVLKLYDAYFGNGKDRRYRGYWDEISYEVSQAIAETHPDKAVQIWKKKAEAHVDRTNPQEYSYAVGYLKKIKSTLLKNKKADEWNGYLREIKAENIRKKRFIEMLNSMEGKRIIDLIR
jgi:uncharacterized Zn finger protein